MVTSLAQRKSWSATRQTCQSTCKRFYSSHTLTHTARIETITSRQGFRCVTRSKNRTDLIIIAVDVWTVFFLSFRFWVEQNRREKMATRRQTERKLGIVNRHENQIMINFIIILWFLFIESPQWPTQVDSRLRSCVGSKNNFNMTLNGLNNAISKCIQLAIILASHHWRSVPHPRTNRTASIAVTLNNQKKNSIRIIDLHIEIEWLNNLVLIFSTHVSDVLWEQLDFACNAWHSLFYAKIQYANEILSNASSNMIGLSQVLMHSASSIRFHFQFVQFDFYADSCLHWKCNSHWKVALILNRFDVSQIDVDLEITLEILWKKKNALHQFSSV